MITRAEWGLKIWEEIQEQRRIRTKKLPDEKSCLDSMFEAYRRLKELGWNDACYCPKDGTGFNAIEIGSTGIHWCHYQGEWPNGRWWIHAHGDLWPARPSLFKLEEKTDAPSDQARPEVLQL